MNTLDTPAQMDTAHTGGYITEFKEKSEFEQRINTAWRRAEPEAVKQLAEAADISPDLDQKIYELAFSLAIIYVNVKARLEKQVLFKVYFKSSHFLHKKVWH
jgi:hypothetical protein